MGADEDNQEASEVTILSVDQPALSLSIPKAWEDIAIIKRQTDIQQSAEAKHGTILFQLYEKTAYTRDEAMGNVLSQNSHSLRKCKHSVVKWPESHPAVSTVLPFS